VKYIACLLLLHALAGPAVSEHHDLVLTAAQQTIQVKAGDTINLVGDSNHLLLVGNCRSIDLVGSRNELKIQGKLDQIQIVGSGNVIRWLSTDGSAPPSMQSLGTNNQLLPYRP
jgi:hypothetical protein